MAPGDGSTFAEEHTTLFHWEGRWQDADLLQDIGKWWNRFATPGLDSVREPHDGLLVCPRLRVGDIGFSVPVTTGGQVAGPDGQVPTTP